MDESLLTSFRSPTIPTYVDLFKVRHSDDQALLLFEDYLCYRALLDVLSLRTSRWEHLVHTLYQYIKDVADNECKRWLCSVNLAIHVRDGINKPNEKTYFNVRKCFIANGDLFQVQFHKKTVDELTMAIGCYLLLIEKDKNKALEVCGTHQKVQDLISAFPDFTEEQNDFMAGKNPHFVLIKILDQLRCVIMKMQPPVLTEIFDEYQCAAEEQKQSVAMEKEKSESKAAKKASDTVASIKNSTNDEPGTSMEVDSPRRSSRSTPSKFKSTTFLKATQATSSPAKPTSLSTSMAICVVPDNPDNGSGVDTTPKKNTPTKSVVIMDDSDTEIKTRKSKIASKIIDSDSEEQQPSSTVRNSNSPAAPRRHKGLRDLKIVGEVSNEWSSDDSDVASKLVPSREICHRRRQSLELPKRFKYKTSSGSRHFWTETEEKNLLKGVETFGLGRWSNILKTFYFAPYRDNVSLKDKWRNMVKNREVPKKYL